jgi:hypothetical protein
VSTERCSFEEHDDGYSPSRSAETNNAWNFATTPCPASLLERIVFKKEYVGNQEEYALLFKAMFKCISQFPTAVPITNTLVVPLKIVSCRCFVASNLKQ